MSSSSESPAKRSRNEAVLANLLSPPAFSAFLPPPPPPRALLSPFDSLPDDMVYVIGTYLDVPGIKSFALISSQYNNCVVQGFCFKDLALKLFPEIDKLYSILPGAKKRTYTEKLKQQFIALRKTKAAPAEREELQRRAETRAETKMQKSLQEDYSFVIRFDLKAGMYDVSRLPLKTKEKDDMVAAFNRLGRYHHDYAMRIINEDPAGMYMNSEEVQIGSLDKLTTATLRKLQSCLVRYADLSVGVSMEKDVVVAKAEWDFPSTEERRTKNIGLRFNLVENAVEFPLWCKLEEYGFPGEDGYEEEKSRRQSFNLENAEYDWGHDWGHSFVEMSIFVVKRESGETAPFIVSESSTECNGSEFKDGDIVEWFSYQNADPRMCSCSSCECGPMADLTAVLLTRKVEGVGGVPDLVRRVDEASIQFQTFTRKFVVPMDLASVMSSFKCLF